MYAILDISGTDVVVVDWVETAEEAIERAALNENHRAVETDQYGLWKSLTGQSLYANS